MRQAFIYCFILILITGSCFNCLAQKHRKKLNLIYAKWDPIIKAPVVPDNIFSLNVDGLVMYPMQSKIKNQPKFYLTISWEAPSIDGHFILTVTKKQVILTSGHENPNPNFLYWFTDINEKQYEQVVSNIDNSKSLFDEQNLLYFYGRQLEYKYLIPEQKPGSSRDRENKMYLNAKTLIGIFNKGLKPKDRVIFPDRKKLKKIKPIITAGNPSEITDFIIKY